MPSVIVEDGGDAGEEESDADSAKTLVARMSRGFLVVIKVTGTRHENEHDNAVGVKGCKHFCSRWGKTIRNGSGDSMTDLTITGY